MIFHPTPLKGAYTIEPEKNGDERGFFARVFCEREFAKAGLNTKFVQANNSFSVQKGTLRGLHFQIPPAAEAKLVRCLRGAAYDVILDLRPDSPTYQKWFGAELNEDNRLMMYVPRGLAHAILTLCDNTEAFYMVSDFYAQQQERGVRYDDPHFSIKWPIKPINISAKDAGWPDFNPEFHDVEQMRGL